jgi:hypothetical protein
VGKMKRIEINWRLPIQGSIIDVEATHFDASKGELFTVGFLSRNGFTIFQRVDSAEKAFKKWVSEEMSSFAEPWFAFNKQCEEGFCGRAITEELQVGEESAYGALKNEKLLDHYNTLNDPLFNEEIPLFWEAWRKTGIALFLSKIVRHNYCCLAKEYYLKLRRIDKLEPENIPQLLISAVIEKKYIRPVLNIDI